MRINKVSVCVYSRDNFFETIQETIHKSFLTIPMFLLRKIVWRVLRNNNELLCIAATTNLRIILGLYTSTTYLYTIQEWGEYISILPKLIHTKFALYTCGFDLFSSRLSNSERINSFRF